MHLQAELAEEYAAEKEIQYDAVSVIQKDSRKELWETTCISDTISCKLYLEILLKDAYVQEELDFYNK